MKLVLQIDKKRNIKLYMEKKNQFWASILAIFWQVVLMCLKVQEQVFGCGFIANQMYILSVILLLDYLTIFLLISLPGWHVQWMNKLKHCSFLFNTPPQADVDGSGTLDYGEFVAVSIHLKKLGNDEHLHKAFAYFDQNRSGYIEIEELRDSLADDLGPNHEEVIDAIIRDVDTDKVCFKLTFTRFLFMSYFCCFFHFATSAIWKFSSCQL